MKTLFLILQKLLRELYLESIIVKKLYATIEDVMVL